MDAIAAYTGEIMGGIAGTLLLIIAAVVLIFYRNWKYEQALDSLLWKVNYKDIQIKEQKDETIGTNETPANSKVIVCLNIAARSNTAILEEIFVPDSFPCAIDCVVIEIAYICDTFISLISIIQFFSFNVLINHCRVLMNLQNKFLLRKIFKITIT